MGFRVEAKIEGLDVLVKRLAEMKASLQRRVLRAAMRKAASLVNKAAKARAAVRTGRLKKSIGVKVKAYPSGVVVGIVEPRAGFRVPAGTSRTGRAKFIDPRLYAHLVERGVKPHAVGRGSSLRKKSQAGRPHPGFAARPFLGPAFDASQSAIVAAFEEQIDKALAAL